MLGLKHSRALALKDEKNLQIALKIKSPEWNRQTDTQTDTEFYKYRLLHRHCVYRYATRKENWFYPNTHKYDNIPSFRFVIKLFIKILIRIVSSNL